jgi:hypothetical protein
MEALCKRLREDAHKLKEEKTTLEGMAYSYGELTMDITKETGLDCMGEDGNDVDEEDEDANDGGDVVAPPVAMAPPLVHTPLLPHLRRLSRRKTL